jgi:hypothetical protein
MHGAGRINSSLENGKRGEGGQAAISISWDGEGVVRANFFNALVGIGWRKKNWGALRDWDFDEGFLML